MLFLSVLRVTSNKKWCFYLRDTRFYVRLSLISKSESKNRTDNIRWQIIIKSSSFSKNFTGGGGKTIYRGGSAPPCPPVATPLKSMLKLFMQIIDHEHSRETIVVGWLICLFIQQNMTQPDNLFC